MLIFLVFCVCKNFQLNEVKQEMPFKSSLSEADKAKAKKELGEYPGSTDTALTILRDKIALEPGLKANLSDEFLVRFLRGRKYDLESTFATVKNYYVTRNEDLMKNFRPSAVLPAINLCVSCPMGYNPKDGTRVIVNRPGLWTAGKENFPFADVMRCNLMVLEHVLKDERTQVHGVTLIIDGTGVGWDHAKELATGIVRQMFRIIQDAMPLRMKAIHYINEPAMMGYIFSLVKPFMKEKTIKRLNFHASDLSSLHKMVDPKVLPEHLGGELPPLPHQEFMQELINSEDYFTEMAQYYFDDPKALFKGSGQDAKDSGVGGTYRKLNTD